MIGKPNRWRDTQRPARFFIFDPWLVVFVGLFLLHIKLWTFLLLLILAVFNLILEFRGIQTRNLHRHLKTFLSGPHITARGIKNQRYPVDYPSELDHHVENYESLTNRRHYISPNYIY